ncbi:phosphocholine cytidylyltransferase family protein [Litoricola sp.]|nr:phosphocholine cytidylyltransferase family protein [Litorivicinus sp.]
MQEPPRAIILAAGRGSRMKDLTSTMPKCRIMLHGKELIRWQIESLEDASIKHLSIVTGYLSETFDLPVTYFHNNDWMSTNMVASLMAAEDWLSRYNCIISYSDIVYNYKIVEELSQSEYDLAIAYDVNWRSLWEQRFKDPLEDAESFKFVGNRLLEVGEKVDRIDDVMGQYMGLLKITPKGWGAMKGYLSKLPYRDLKKLDMTSCLNQLVKENIEVNIVPNKWPWYEIDTKSDLDLYTQFGRF